jgi:hypothetical protein
MFSEAVSYVGSILAMRGDLLANDAFLPTANSTEAVINHLNLIGQKFLRQTPATVQIMATVEGLTSTDIRIPAGQSFSIAGPDNLPIIYEMFSSPFDWVSDIVIPAKSGGIVTWAIEGRFVEPTTAVSDGSASQSITITNDDIIEVPIIVSVDGTNWTQVDNLSNHNESAEVYEVVLGDNTFDVTFGDNINGKIPVSGQVISVTYRVGGGERGRIGSGAINTTRSFSPEPPATAPVAVTFRNLQPSNGGHNAETIEDAKKRAPGTWSTHDSAVTGNDYKVLSESFNHPVYGRVSKAVSAIKTSINANIVEVYALAEGPDSIPVVPSVGLKQGLETYLESKNVFTDDVRVYDGSIKAVDVDMTVVLFRNVDAGAVKEQINQTIDNFFDISNRDMGDPLYVSDLYNLIMNISGVSYVNIVKPSKDILSAKDVSDDGTVEFNELITLGSKDIKVHFEKTN